MRLSENEITPQAGNTRILTRSEPMYASRARVENSGWSIWNILNVISADEHRNGPKEVKLSVCGRLYDFDSSQSLTSTVQAHR
jgi:hypothetical protein